MEVICRPVGSYQANCYIVIENKNALVIDPGDESTMLIGLIESLGAKVQAVLLTHAHFDHIGAVDAIARTFGCDVYINPDEYKSMLEQNSARYALSGIPARQFDSKAKLFSEGEQKIGGFDVTAYFLPGHSAGSTVLKIGDNLFTGDVLFQGSVGRVDLPGGSAAQMKKSLEFIKTLPPQDIVYPGHGPSTTLGAEIDSNPYLIYDLF